MIHKLIIPPPKIGHLRDVLLCNPNEITPNVRFSTNINEVDCPECWKIWMFI